MLVILTETPTPELEWLDPLTLSTTAARVIRRIEHPLIIAIGGKVLATLLSPVPLLSFRKIRGLWVRTSVGVVYAAGNPLADTEVRSIVRESVRRGLVR